MQIVHLTSVHQRYDTRIFVKECKSLTGAYGVTLVVADGKGNEVNNGVNIIDIGILSGRFNRMFKTTKLMFKKALSLDADIYHLHDPELIPIGLKLLKKNKKVIFDAHEDLPKQILSKPYLKTWQRKPLAFIASLFEKYALKKFTGIIAATPYIRDKFLSINKNTLDINNFPILGELSSLEADFDIETLKKENQICYIGGLEKTRGIKEIVESLEFTKTRLALAGFFSQADFESQIKSLETWKKVDFLGFLNREEVKKVLQDSILGLVTLHPISNYLDALPVKMFEYMSAGLPVIASDFSLWREIIEKNNCGICVDPLNSRAIASAINTLLEDAKLAKTMGENGRKLVFKKYNWSIESEKLFKFYKNIEIL